MNSLINDKNRYEIIPDNPLENYDDIQNGSIKQEISQFIDQIYSYIDSYKSGYSLTLGLEGTWGSGKSSILNLLEKKMMSIGNSKRSDIKSGIVKFNPWYYTDTSNLISQFFKHLSIQLSTNKFGNDEIIECLSSLSDALSTISSIVGVIDPVTGSFIKIGGLVTKFLTKNKTKPKNDLWSIREDLYKKLKKISKPIIVIIDDIDRLHSHEIKDMLQAIRAIGNLPNIIYIFAYDREIVSKACSDNDNGIDGESYLEKIIQIRMSVPTNRKQDLVIVIDNQLVKYRIKDVDKDGSNYTALLILLANYVTTYRQIKQILNRFFYRLQFYRNNMCLFDLFVLSIIEVFFTDVALLIQRCPPIKGDYNWNNDLQILDHIREEERTNIFIKEIDKLYPLNNDTTTNEITNDKRSDNKVTLEIKASLVRYLCRCLFSFQNNDLKINVPAPDINPKKYIFRISESTSFLYYFNYSESRSFTYAQYIEYLNQYKKGTKFILTDVKKPILVQFLNECLVRYDAGEIDTYISFCVSLAKYVPDKQDFEMYRATDNLIRYIINDEINKDKIINALLNDDTGIMYLFNIYEDYYQYRGYSDDKQILELDNKYGKRIINQFNLNFIKQIDILHNSIYSNSIFPLIIGKRKNYDLNNAYNTLINHDVLCLDMICYYANVLVNYIMPQELKGFLIDNIGRELLLKRINGLQKLNIYTELDESSKERIEKLYQLLRGENEM